jgi:two-component system sensor histidine kinase VicK
MQEVLTNVINNAIKYTPEGSVTVSLTGDPSVIQLQVADTGPGISADDLPHLFQKFYRVDNSMTRSIGGTGLGLFICRKIVELYNGRIWAESQLGKGTTFFINLPRLSTAQALEMQKNQASIASPLDAR